MKTLHPHKNLCISSHKSSFLTAKSKYNINFLQLNIVVHACNPSIQESEAGGLQDENQIGKVGVCLANTLGLILSTVKVNKEITHQGLEV
jgi:hypothetical protein